MKKSIKRHNVKLAFSSQQHFKNLLSLFILLLLTNLCRVIATPLGYSHTYFCSLPNLQSYTPFSLSSVTDSALDDIHPTTRYSTNSDMRQDFKLLWKYHTYFMVSSSPALGDIDGDGKLEVVVGSADCKIYAINAESGTLVWSYESGWPTISSPALGDIDGDGKLEVIIGSWDYNVYALNGKDGSLLWLHKTKWAVESSAALADVDGDGNLEVVIGSWDHNVYTLNGNRGSLLWNYTTNGGVRSSPALYDLDGDDRLELIVGSNDGNVYAFDLPSAGIHVYWEGLGGTSDFTRTSNLQDIDPDLDGLSSAYEELLGTNPNKADTDGDGYSDSAELRAGTGPNNILSSPSTPYILPIVGFLAFSTVIALFFSFRYYRLRAHKYFEKDY